MVAPPFFWSLSSGMHWLLTSISPTLIVSFLVLGTGVGFAAGLLGIGGAMLLVPFLTAAFTAQHFPADHVVHIAIATSLATILFTSISSVRAHHQRGAVLWSVVKILAPGIVLGSLVGAQIAGAIKTSWLAIFFGLFIGFSAFQMLLDRRPAASRELPGRRGMLGAGFGIGMISSLVGAGGGFMSVPFMSWCNVAMRNAVGTSAALGFPIAFAGAIGYIVAGLRFNDMPAGNVGFINLPALVCIVATSAMVAPLGARVAHRMEAKTLRRIFAVLLLAVGAYMLYRGLHTL